MNVRMKIVIDGEKHKVVDLDTSKGGNAKLVATPLLLWKDVSNTDVARGLELEKWKIKRGTNLNGTAAEEGPNLRTGDYVIFHARTKREPDA